MAITRYEQAIALKPDYAEPHYSLGLALQSLGRVEAAIARFEQAIVIEPRNAEAHLNLGHTLQSLGRMEAAIARFEQIIVLKPDYAEVHYKLTMIKPNQEQIPIIEKLLSSSTISENDAMHCHFALGNIFKDANSYSKSFEHYHKANTLKRKTITYDSQNHSNFVDRLIKNFTKSYFQGKTASGSDSELPVFIVGMPRSGTTLVEQIISSHPQVYGAGELIYLELIVRKITEQFKSSSPYPECMSQCDDSLAFRFSLEYLEKLRNYAQDSDRITDKMPSNFLGIGLIKTLFPKARIIHCQRNALDICMSIYTSNFRGYHGYAYELKELGQHYLDYMRMMRHWQGLFHSEIFDVQYEELVMNQEVVSRQLIDYIGLEWDEKCLDFHKNNRPVDTVSNIQVRQPIYKTAINKWEQYMEYVDPLREVLKDLN